MAGCVEGERVNQWGGGDTAGGAILMGTFEAPTDTFMFITFESQLVALLCSCQCFSHRQVQFFKLMDDIVDLYLMGIDEPWWLRPCGTRAL